MPEFCEICGSIMKVKEEKSDAIIYICPVCGNTKNMKRKRDSKESIGLVLKVKDEREINEIIDESKIKKQGGLVSVICPKCGHDKAYVVSIQTRAADEPPTRIYHCEKCGHTWREYS